MLTAGYSLLLVQEFKCMQYPGLGAVIFHHIHYPGADYASIENHTRVGAQELLPKLKRLKSHIESLMASPEAYRNQLKL